VGAELFVVTCGHYFFSSPFDRDFTYEEPYSKSLQIGMSHSWSAGRPKGRLRCSLGTGSSVRINGGHCHYLL
jgi:hypothetical protein